MPSVPIPRYGHRSEPHTHAAETLMIASVGSTSRGSSRSSTRTSPGPYIIAPRTPRSFPPGRVAGLVAVHRIPRRDRVRGALGVVVARQPTWPWLAAWARSAHAGRRCEHGARVEQPFRVDRGLDGAHRGDLRRRAGELEPAGLGDSDPVLRADRPAVVGCEAQDRFVDRLVCGIRAED